jgi:hypothetical protein
MACFLFENRPLHFEIDNPIIYDTASLSDIQAHM